MAQEATFFYKPMLYCFILCKFVTLQYSHVLTTPSISICNGDFIFHN
jgi:hypothetical protein